VVYRVLHDGPFRLQPEEVVRGEFVPPGEIAGRAARDPFCPDGLAVRQEYQRSAAVLAPSPTRGEGEAEIPGG
jgi:hypothetical protein